MNILIAEDNPVSAKILSLNLAKHGYRVVAAADGRQALNLMQKDPDIQLAIIDLKMPNFNGVELIEAMKNDKNLREIPVIISSSENASAVVSRVIELGVQKYVVKPIRAQQLIQDVKQILRHDGEVLLPKTRVIGRMQIDRDIYTQMSESFAALVNDTVAFLRKVAREETAYIDIDEMNVLYESAEILGAERLQQCLDLARSNRKITSYHYYYLLHELEALQKVLPKISGAGGAAPAAVSLLKKDLAQTVTTPRDFN